MSSPSLLSEPLDIRNVFSSYTYQSPELDSNEDFCVSPTRVGEGEYDEKGLCVEDSEGRVKLRKSKRSRECGIGCIKNGCHSIARESTDDAEISACHDSLSLPSEPPDIANWFSSYAYESPELDTADFDVSPSSPNDNSENVDEESRELYKELTVEADNESVSRGSEMKATFPKTKNRKKCSTAQVHILEKNDISSENNLCSEVTLEASAQVEFLGNCRITADESVLCRRFKTENARPIMQKEVQTNDTDQPLIICKTSSKEAFAETCENMKQNTTHISVNDSGWIKLNRISRDPYYKGRKPDDNQYARTENGPTSLMKNMTPRINDENCHPVLGPTKIKVENNITDSVSNSENKKAKDVTREVFKETTNTQHPYAHESAGKWRCPLKNKPNTGPPLKQLRLERWVRRI